MRSRATQPARCRKGSARPRDPADTGGHDQLPTTSVSLSGTLSCPRLEELREQAGGSDVQAVVAASIAMAESSGQQFATGAVGERGYWQINPDRGSLSTYDPLGNAQGSRHHLRRRRQLDRSC